MIKKFIIGCSIIFLASQSPAQTFQETFSSQLQGIENSLVAWGDYDGDGDLDVFLSGDDGANIIARIYQNTGTGFTEVYAGQIFPPNGTISYRGYWGDMDGDGDLDLIFAGSNSLVYRNTGSGFEVYLSVQNGNFQLGGVKWFDWNNDGWLDIFAIDSNSETFIYQNTGNGFEKVMENIFPILTGAPMDVDFGDVDGNGYLDVIFFGNNSQAGQSITQIFLNSGANFTEAYTGQIIGERNGEVLWGDYDADGDLDVLISGNSNTRIYTNTGTEFTQLQQLRYNYQSFIDWADITGDGYLEILEGGYSDSTRIYFYNGAEFILDYRSQLNLYIGGPSDGEFGDYDGDGDLDIVITGNLISKIFENQSETPNAAPTPPTNLSTSISQNGQVTFNWTAATDAETPSLGLNYDIFVGTATGTGNKRMPHAILSTGRATIPERGPIQGTTWVMNDLPNGTYFWSVQAVDGGLRRSPFATEGTFTIDVAVAANPVTTSPESVTTTSFIATWELDEAVSSYELQLAGSEYFLSDDTLFQTITLRDTSRYAFNGLIANTPYYYRVRGSNPAGTSGWSNIIRVGQGVTLTNVQANAGIVGEEIILTGTGFSPVLTANRIFFGEVETSPLSSNTAGNQLLVRIPSGTQDNATISLNVFGNIASFGTPFSLRLIAKPTDFTAIRQTNTAVLAWTAVDEATSYNVYRGTTPATLNLVGSVTTTTFTNTALTAGTSYYYRVTAVDSQANESAQSNEKVVTMPNASATSLSGNLIENETLTVSGSPYSITGDFGVPAGITLTIEPGVVINFTGDFRIFISGVIHVLGEANNPVTFIGNNVEGSKYQLEIRRTNLHNQIINNLVASGPQQLLKLGESSDATQNVGDLVIKGGKFSHSKIVMDGTSSGNQLNRLILLDTRLDSVNLEQLNANSRLSILGSSFFNSHIRHDKVNMENGALVNSILETKNTRNIYEITNSRWINSAFRTHDLNYEKIQFSSLLAINTLFNIQAPLTATNSQFLFNRSLAVGNRLDGHDINSDTSMFFFRLNAGYSDPYLFENCSFSGTTGITAIRWQKGASNNGNQNKSIVNSVFNNFDVFVSASEYPLTLSGNNLLNVNRHTIEVRDAVDINAQGNYWGSNSITTIASTIYDQNDDFDLGIVDFSNRLSELSLIPPTTSPTGVVKQANGSGIQLTWQANPESNTAGYRIYYDLQSDFTFKEMIDVGNVTTFEINGLSENELIAVTAYNTDADGYLDIQEGKESTYTFAAGVPDAPQNLQTSNITTSGFIATWDVVLDATGYRLDVSEQEDFSIFVEGYENKAIVGTNESITGLKANTIYFWRVRSENAAGASDHSNSGQIRTLLFEEVNINQLVGVESSAVAWGDYDGDGDLDLLLTGFKNSYLPTSKIYENTGSTLIEVFSGQLEALGSSSVVWGDYDRDGDLDILLTGFDGNQRISKIYENTEAGFSEVFAGQLEGVAAGRAAWGDYDQDGNLDILLTGASENYNTGFSTIYKNTGSGFTEVFGGQLTGVYIHSSATWGDYDRDGDLDILLTGFYDNVWDAISKIYQNTGSGFMEVFAGQLDGVSNSSVVWGDYDGDGDLDILLTGGNNSDQTISKIYENTGVGFSEVYSGQLTAVYFSSAIWGDYDGDGDLDILLTGFDSSSQRISKIYENTGSGFTEVFAGQLTGVFLGSVAWGDFDGDGDLDILITGNDKSGNSITKIYENKSATSNLPPSQITSLTSEVNGGKATFNWEAPADDTTPKLGLNYNLYIGSESGKQDIRPAHADLSTGLRRIAERGHIQGTSWTIQNLKPGTYFWGVQAIDAGFAGGQFSAEQSFTIESNAILEFSATSLDFGEVSLKFQEEIPIESHPLKRMIIKNIGSENLTITSVFYPTGFFGDYTSGTLAPGQTDTISVRFTPTAQQDYSTRITLVSNKTSGPNGFDVIGRGSNTVRYEIAYHPSIIDFGSVNLFSSNTKSVYLVNIGNISFTMFGLFFRSESGYFSTNFTQLYADRFLQPNDSIKIDIIFSPETAGEDNRSFFLSASTFGLPQLPVFENLSVNLSGFGYDPSIPLAPQNLSFTSVEFDQVNLIWDLTNQSVSYEVQIASDENFSSIVQSKSVNINSAELTGLTELTNYYARVRGINEESVAGPFSTTLFFSTPSEDPFSPIALDAVDIGFNQFTATWDAVAGAESYEIDVSTSYVFNTFVTGYNAFNTGNVNQLVITGLRDNTTYFYRVRSNIDGITLSKNSSSIVVVTLNAAPIPNEASGITQSSFIASWQPVDNIAGYILQVATSQDFTNLVANFENLFTTETSIVVSGLDDLTQYYYRVRSRISESSESGYHSFITLTTPLAVPLTPVITGVTDIGLFSANIGWESSTNAVGYYLTVSQNPDFSSPHFDSQLGNVTELQVTDLLYNTTYYYRLAGFNATGTGTYATGEFNTLPDIDPPTGKFTGVPASLLPNSLSFSLTLSDNIGIETSTVNLWKKQALAESYSAFEPTSINQNVYMFTLSATDFDAIGATLFATFSDPSGNVGSTDTLTVLTQKPSSETVEVPEIKTGTSIKDYQIIAFPYQSSPVTTVLKDLGTFDIRDWRLFRYTNQQYQEYDAFTNLEPGRGYWLIVGKNINSISFSNVLPVPSSETQPYRMVLNQGWNLIGNPYTLPINWSEVVTHNQNKHGLQPNDIGQLLIYDKGYQVANGLKVYEGAFIFANSANLFFDIPYLALSNGNARYGFSYGEPREGIMENGWEMVITMRSKELNYAVGGIGEHVNALSGYDSWDMLEPIHFTEYLTLTDAQAMQHKVTRSIVPVSDEINVWKMKVATHLDKGTLLTMEFKSNHPSASDKKLMLFDQEAGNIVDINNQHNYSFIFKPGYQLTFLHGDAAQIDAWLGMQTSLVGKIYPNPTQDQIFIPLLMSNDVKDAWIEIDLVDVSGRVAQKISGKGLPMNFNELEVKLDSWLPNGIYIVKIKLHLSGSKPIYAEQKIFINKNN